MITLRWAPFPEADIVSYKIYRSIIGFAAPLVSVGSLAGKTLMLKFNGSATQVVTFDGSTPIITQINDAIVGGNAYQSLVNIGEFIVRSDIREAPGTVQIVGGTALSDFGLTARLISEKSEDVLIGSVLAAPSPDTLMEFEDEDGVLQDWYAISTISSLSEESLKTLYRQPITYTGKVCVIEGVINDLQGRRIPDVSVTAQLCNYLNSVEPAAMTTVDSVTTQTGPDGRFSLAVLQKMLIQLEIPAIAFSRNITVPEKAYVFITDLLVDMDYRYNGDRQ